MAYTKSKTVRFEEIPEPEKPQVIDADDAVKVKYRIDGIRLPEPSLMKGENESQKPGATLKAKVLSRKFSEDFERVKKKILDPREPIIHRWNKIFLVACLVSLFVDPLFFYLPVAHKNMCIDLSTKLEVALTITRSVADIFYIIQIFVRFRTAYIAPSSLIFGRGEHVIDSTEIALKYMSKSFWIDFVAALPLPQVLIWVIIPNLKGSTMANTRNVLRFIIVFQYLPRLYLIFPWTSQIVKATGVVTETAWAGAAYNLMLYMLASHVLGACWYLLSIERQEACWRDVCSLEKLSCHYIFFDCRMIGDSNRNVWYQASNITSPCDPNRSSYPFGDMETFFRGFTANNSGINAGSTHTSGEHGAHVSYKPHGQGSKSARMQLYLEPWKEA